MVGWTQEIPIPHRVQQIGLGLVKSKHSASVIVGVQVIVELNVVSSLKFINSMDIGTSHPISIVIRCRQISGHVSNDGKQINILNGQGTCTVGYPMPCCMVSKAYLGRPPEWLMRMFLRQVLSAVSAAKSNQ